MAFSDEEEQEPARQRKRARGKSSPAEAPWPSKDQPLSWAMLPPEEEEEVEEEVPAAAPPTRAAPAPPAPPGAAAVEGDWRSRYSYLLAEFDNYRRRVQKETESSIAQAEGKILLKVIALHEGIEHALAALPPDAKSVRDGLSLVLRNMDSLLREEGFEPVASEGRPFQPDLHEAVGQVPATAKSPEGSVAVIVQQGYRGPSGLVRPAKVLVAAGPPPASKQEKGPA